MEHDSTFYAKRSEERYQRGDAAGGNADLDRAIELDPTSLEYRWARIRSHFDADEQYPHMIEDLSKVIELSMDLTELEEAYSKRAIARGALGQHTELVSDLNWLIDHGYSSANRYNWRADGRAKLGDLEGAIEDLTEARELSPDDTTTQLRHAVALYRVKRYEQAIEELTSILNLNRDGRLFLAALHSWRGKAFYQLGKHEEALSDFNEDMRLSYGTSFTDATAYMRAIAPEDLYISD